MSASYPDLTNAFPDVASDERYLYRDVTIDDVPFITQYENLYNAVRTAHDASSRQTAWEALEAFKKTDGYTQHVYPVMQTATKMQTLEDKVISAQRFAKGQRQQWTFSDTEPDTDVQTVDDLWLRKDLDNDDYTAATVFKKAETGKYKRLSFSMDSGKITDFKVVSELPEDIENHPTVLYFLI